MADPFSIVASCAGLIAFIGSTTVVVSTFVRDVRSARGELDAVSRELGSLKTLVELIAEDHEEKTFPENLCTQITGLISNCSVVVREIDQEIQKHVGNRAAKNTRWAMFGKANMSNLKTSLEGHKSALNMALELVTITLAKDIKRDTGAIRNDVSEMRPEVMNLKENTDEILAEIRDIKRQMKQNAIPTDASGSKVDNGEILHGYLNSLTDYAEILVGDFSHLEVVDYNDQEDYYKAPRHEYYELDAPFGWSSADLKPPKECHSSGVKGIGERSRSPYAMTTRERIPAPYLEGHSRPERNARQPSRPRSPGREYAVPISAPWPGKEVAHYADPKPAAVLQKLASGNETPEESFVRERDSLPGFESKFRSGKFALKMRQPDELLRKLYAVDSTLDKDFTHSHLTAFPGAAVRFYPERRLFQPDDLHTSFSSTSTSPKILISLQYTSIGMCYARVNYRETFNSLMELAKYLDNRPGFSSENLIVAIMVNKDIGKQTENPKLEELLPTFLEDIGVYTSPFQADGRIQVNEEGDLPDGIEKGLKLPTHVNGVEVQANVFEYTTRLFPCGDGDEVAVDKTTKLKVILCVHREGHCGSSQPHLMFQNVAYSSGHWQKALGKYLQPDISIQVAPQERVEGDVIIQLLERYTSYMNDAKAKTKPEFLHGICYSSTWEAPVSTVRGLLRKIGLGR